MISEEIRGIAILLSAAALLNTFMEESLNLFSAQLLPLALGICSALLLYYFIMGNEASSTQHSKNNEEEEEPKRGFTLTSLKKYNGVEEEKIFIALKGVVYDVTRGGQDFYGVGGSYHVFAG